MLYAETAPITDIKTCVVRVPLQPGKPYFGCGGELASLAKFAPIGWTDD